MVHDLKIENIYLGELISGKKKAEIRVNDRKYAVGDILLFRRPKDNFQFKVTHIHEGLGMKENYVVLSVKRKSV